MQDSINNKTNTNLLKFYDNMDYASRIAALVTLFVIPLSTGATSILYVVTLVFILLSGRWQERFHQIASNPAALSFFGLFVIFVLGTFYSAGSWYDISRQLVRYNWLLLAPLLIPLFISEKWKRLAINAFLFAMIITLLFSYAKYFDWITFGRSHVSIFKSRIIQNFLMAFATFILFYRWKNHQPYRWIYAITIIFMSINVIFMSEGRSGYLVYGALLIYSCAYFYSWKGLLYALIGFSVMLGLAYNFSNSFHSRINQAFVDVHQYDKGQVRTSLGYRMTWIKNGVTLIEKKPLIGYGTGSIKVAYGRLPQKVVDETGIITNMGNEYFNFLVQFGFVGLVYLFAMFYIQWRYSENLSDEWKFTIHIFLIGMALGNIFNSWLTDTTQAHLYALLIPIAFAALSQQKTGFHKKIKLDVGKPVTA